MTQPWRTSWWNSTRRTTAILTLMPCSTGRRMPVRRSWSLPRAPPSEGSAACPFHPAHRRTGEGSRAASRLPGDRCVAARGGRHPPGLRRGDPFAGRHGLPRRDREVWERGGQGDF